MSIPDYQTLMLPLLKLIADGNEYHLSPLVSVLSDNFKLTQEERKQLLPSGQMTTIKSRAGWARTYLKKAGLLEQPKRGYLKITSRGVDVLNKNLEKIDAKFLEQYPEFITFRDAGKNENSLLEQIENIETTPEENIENSIFKINNQLSNDLLDAIKSCSPVFFEKLVVELLLAMGYGGSRAGAGRATQQTADGGIDGIIDEDKLGLDAIYIQAKRWENVIGSPEIQKFVGALQGNRAHKGVFITTSDFTKSAKEYVKNIQNKVILIDGLTLAKLMIENNVGVSTITTYAIKKIDTDYFIDE
jgi:restriction system protein